MIFISSTIIIFLKFSTTLAYKSCVSPFQWNCETNQLKYDPYSWWHYVRYFYIFHEIFLCWRLLESSLDSNKTYSRRAEEIIYIVAISTPTCLQLVFNFQKKDLLQVFNRFLDFMYKNEVRVKFCKENYGRKRIKKRPPWQTASISILGFLYAATVLTTMAINVHFVRNTTEKLFISSLFLPFAWLQLRKPIAITIGLLLNSWFLLSSWACINFFASLYVTAGYTTIFLLKQLRLHKFSPFTKKSLRYPTTALEKYKATFILVTQLNCITRKYLLIVVNNTMIVCAVLGNIILVEFRFQVKYQNLVAIVSLSMTATGFLLLSYVKLGEINESSKKLISNFLHKGYLSFNGMEKFQFLRSAQGLMPLRIYLSDFGYYTKPSSLKIVGRIFFYTSKGLLISDRLLSFFSM